MATKLKFTVDYEALRQALQKAPNVLKGDIHKLLERSAIMTQGKMKENVNTGVSGELKKSIRYRFTDPLTVIVEPTAKHALPHETGSRPHWVGVKKLKSWADVKGINVYALQKHIAKKGTKAHPFVKPTLKYVDGRIYPDFNKGMNKSIKNILGE